jgi:hypothetical protein
MGFTGHPDERHGAQDEAGHADDAGNRNPPSYSRDRSRGHPLAFNVRAGDPATRAYA